MIITCKGNGSNSGSSGQVYNGIIAGTFGSPDKRFRNKNPNCNHNSNSGDAYQKHYNNVNYDSIQKTKEDILRKVFFKACVPPGPNEQMYVGLSEIAR